MAFNCTALITGHFTDGLLFQHVYARQVIGFAKIHHHDRIITGDQGHLELGRGMQRLRCREEAAA
ncbi:hypothetical protein D3C77_431720 [compost metagenome]